MLQAKPADVTISIVHSYGCAKVKLCLITEIIFPLSIPWSESANSVQTFSINPEGLAHYSFIPYILTEQSPYTRHCSRHWEYAVSK